MTLILKPILLSVLLFSSLGFAKNNVVEEFDPYSADVEQQLENFDQKYFEQTGQSPF
jgi:hypothetical protein